ncbi:hypothetical protein D3C71_1961690 [compost metagenome]
MIGPRLDQRQRVIGADQHPGVLAFPNMRVLVWLDAQAVEALLLQYRVKKRVVAPIGHDHHGAGRQVLAAQQRVDRV